MSVKTDWERVYQEKAPESVTAGIGRILRRHSNSFRKAACDQSSAIIDVGGGESTFVDDLVERGYQNVTVLDVSETAIEVTRRRLGKLGENVRWIVGDITSVELEADSFDIWHDRAVFHFLASPEQRSAYVRQVARSVRAGGYVLVSTFGPEGPTKCSGFGIVRYDADSLHDEFGVQFRLLKSLKEVHPTPLGTAQQFVYCLCRIE